MDNTVVDPKSFFITSLVSPSLTPFHSSPETFHHATIITPQLSSIMRYEPWDISSTWILELLSAALSVLSLAALAGVLAYTDGRELVAWHSLTLNTVISILSTISRLSAIFVLCESIAQVKWAIFAKNARSLLDFETIDAASRGPVGAFWLVWRGKRIALVGAVAILLALVFDPFAQQLVRWRTEDQFESSELARLPRALRYGKGNRVADSAVVGLSRDDGVSVVTANADFSMQSAVFYGLTQPLNEVSQQLRLGCPTGNCTWDPSESLAVCSKCTDLSNDLERSESTGQSTSVLMDTSNSGSTFGNVVKFTLPNKLSIDNYESVAPDLLMTSWGTGNGSATVHMADVDTLIWSMTILRINPDDQNSTKTWPEVGLEAAECALYYCVKRYDESYTNNNLSHSWTEVTTATRAQDSWQPVQSSVEQYQAELTDADIKSLAFDDSLSAVERTDLQLGDDFNVSQAAVDGLSSFFQNTFAANISNINNTNGFYMHSSANTQYKPAAIQALVSSPDLNATFTALAESMSNAIRAGDDDSTADTGAMGTSVTRYKVHWPWIALPILVVLASVAQLVITIRASGDAPLWKNSALAVLSRGKHVGDLFEEDVVTVTAMQNAVGKSKVLLFPRGIERRRIPKGKEGWNNARDGADSSAVELKRYPSTWSSAANTPMASPSVEDLTIQHPEFRV